MTLDAISESGGNGLAIECDVSDYPSVQQAIEEVADIGRIEVSRTSQE